MADQKVGVCSLWSQLGEPPRDSGTSVSNPSPWAGHVLQRGVILFSCRSSLAASFLGIGGKRGLKEGGVVCRATPSSVRPVHPARTGPRKALGGS